MVRYVWAFDLSLSCSGICIFSGGGNPICLFSIPTTSSVQHKDRLRMIADRLLSMKELYPPRIAIFEKSFSRYTLSTQYLNEVSGMVQYLFNDCDQIFYPPSTVKKTTTGDGKADKKLVQEIMSKRFPNIHSDNFDQSDSIAVGVTYFLKNGVNIMQ
jgi:Holliday junction resolvasome RuvABC endonuclease subunit